jgi:hypothetical protein
MFHLMPIPTGQGRKPFTAEMPAELELAPGTLDLALRKNVAEL